MASFFTAHFSSTLRKRRRSSSVASRVSGRLASCDVGAEGTESPSATTGRPTPFAVLSFFSRGPTICSRRGAAAATSFAADSDFRRPAGLGYLSGASAARF